jgi:alpha-2-macroglobulin
MTKLGELVQVTLSINTPQGGQYILVEDPLPAGLEPIDTSLATSQQVKTGQRDRVWTRVELHDDRVALSATSFSSGAHTFTYLARATTTRMFRVLPAHAEMMYAPEVNGRSDGTMFEVKDR